jgi:hypothetical protein
MNFIDTLRGGRQEVDPGFKWKTRDDEFVRPKDMHTSHLFYTWLMIWNHSAPEEYRVRFKHRYSFGSYYTVEYMVEAFKNMTAELKSRKDIDLGIVSVLKDVSTKLHGIPANPVSWKTVPSIRREP